VLTYTHSLQPTILNDNVNQFKVGLETDKGDFTLKAKTVMLMSHFFLLAIVRTIPAKKFRPPFSCHFTKIGCSLLIVIMIDVCKLKFEIYYCHMSTCEVRLFVPKGYFTAYVSGMTVVDEIFVRHCTLDTHLEKREQLKSPFIFALLYEEILVL
jgi:hypothetical protein